ncbi:hypothetical protein JHW45_10650 [Paracoccus stylophorae]|uniref:Uncharacterized protein n=1 Tax=Paracoccus stylophorae TaxID=659350 RepID=A0ABY7SRD6_9RHOB|nr:hypothetical protein [Paracoccus stylophorae]WCR09575.1 hypothetical protein JHW45_10650 [Paracoccus stylophorae]
MTIHTTPAPQDSAAYWHGVLNHILDGNGEMPAGPVKPPAPELDPDIATKLRAIPDGPERAYVPAHDEWMDAEGRIWDAKTHPRPTPATPDQPAAPSDPIILTDEDMDFLRIHAEAEESQPVTRLAHQPGETRYDAAFIDARNAEQDFATAFKDHGAGDPRTTEAGKRVIEARARFKRVQEQYKEHPDAMRRIDQIAEHRQTPEGKRGRSARSRSEYAAKKGGNVRAYMDLSPMSDADRKQHKRGQARQRMRKKRAAAKAEKDAANSA